MVQLLERWSALELQVRSDPNEDPDMKMLLDAFSTLHTIAPGALANQLRTAIGDIVDENELLTGERQEGLFYSARAFFAKASNSVGHLFAGLMLEYYVRLPQQAVPGELDADIIMRLGITAGPIMGVAAIFSLLIYNLYNLNRERHQQILRELRERADKR